MVADGAAVLNPKSFALRKCLVETNEKLTDTRSDRRSALLVSFGTSVAGKAGDPILARTLPGCHVAGSSQRSDGMTFAR